jgi:hypothetical protein
MHSVRRDLLPNGVQVSHLISLSLEPWLPYVEVGLPRLFGLMLYSALLPKSVHFLLKIVELGWKA